MRQAGNKSSLLLFEELESCALDIDNENIVFFGERDLINVGNKKYDCIFHVLPEIVFSEIDDTVSLSIPVLKKAEHGSDGVFIEMSRLYSENNLLNKICVSGGNSLDFYEIIPKEIGKEIGGCGHSTVKEKEFFEYVENSKLEEHIQEVRNTLNQRYRNLK